MGAPHRALMCPLNSFWDMRLLEPISAAIGRRQVKSKQFTCLLQNLTQLWKRNLKAEYDKNHDNITGFKPSEGRSKAVCVQNYLLCLVW